jgi:hypothetical protein
MPRMIGNDLSHLPACSSCGAPRRELQDGNAAGWHKVGCQNKDRETETKRVNDWERKEGRITTT